MKTQYQIKKKIAKRKREIRLGKCSFYDWFECMDKTCKYCNHFFSEICNEQNT